MKNGMRVALLLLALAGSLLTFRLGFWQLDRAAQKLAWQSSIAERGQLPALQTQDLAAAGADAQLNRHVHLRGHWLADKTVFLDNRPMQGRVGFFVVTPLQLEGRSQAVLVQRGWAPRDAQDRSRLPPAPTPAGLVEVEGRLAASPSRLYEFSTAASGPIRQNIAVDSFAPDIDLLPLTVVQLASATEDGLLRDWPAVDAGLQKNYGYAFQWFALCALILGLYVWFQLIQPRRKQSSSS
jgi:surfeit locus 1 family protein